MYYNAIYCGLICVLNLLIVFQLEYTRQLTFCLCCRWQPASEPADERYIGDNFGHSDIKFGLQFTVKSADESEEVTMEKLKKTWGI